MQLAACALSLGRDACLNSCSVLLLGQGTEEVNLVLARRLPRIVRLECALKMRFDIYVERLRL